jgi:hypothetical protein
MMNQTRRSCTGSQTEPEKEDDKCQTMTIVADEEGRGNMHHRTIQTTSLRKQNLEEQEWELEAEIPSRPQS